MNDMPAAAEGAAETVRRGDFFGRVDRLAARIAGLTRWRRYGLAAGLGAVATLSLPPLDLVPAFYVAFPGLVWLLAGARSRRAAFAIGWCFAFGHLTISLYWVGNALLTFGADFAWLLPFATIGLPAVLAVYGGLAALAARWVQGGLRRAAARGSEGAVPAEGYLRLALLLTVAWATADWLRGHLFTGFPWNLAGHAWAGPDALVQLAAILGIYGVGLVALLSACLPAALAGGGPRRRLTALALALALPLAAWAGGAARLAAAPAPGTAVVPGVGLRIVQAGIPQREKWEPDLRVRNFRRHLALSAADRPDWITHIIWPETAATLFPTEYPQVREAMAAVVPPGGLLITGAPRRQPAPFRIWNSVVAVDDGGRIVGVYDKFHLVPFGEYMPFRGIIPFKKITHGTIDYSAGPGPRTLHLDSLPPFSPLVCYEVIFPGRVLDPADRPDWLLNLTNDAWYGKTAGPHQHLAIARVRAVEEGLPLIRAANTGISAIIDAHGRVLSQLELDRSGVIDSRLPMPLPGLTPYARFGDLLFFFLLLATAAVALLAPRKEKGKKSGDKTG